MHFSQDLFFVRLRVTCLINLGDTDVTVIINDIGSDIEEIPEVMNFHQICSPFKILAFSTDEPEKDNGGKR